MTSSEDGEALPEVRVVPLVLDVEFTEDGATFAASVRVSGEAWGDPTRMHTAEW